MKDVFGTLASSRLVPVVEIDPGADVTRLGLALAMAGLPSAEVTLRTPNAIAAIRELAQIPGFMVGAGTVVEPAQVERALDAGAQYIVSPGFSPIVSRECSLQEVPLIPGAVTATEVLMANEGGHSVVKFFPAAASGGPAMIRALSAPFPGVRFIPTGGVDAATLSDYLAVSSVLAVGGTWLAPRDLIGSGEFDEIGARTIEALAVAERQGR